MGSDDRFYTSLKEGVHLNKKKMQSHDGFLMPMIFYFDSYLVAFLCANIENTKIKKNIWISIY